jgi:adenosylcobinamide-phosphate guanylyltransferase
MISLVMAGGKGSRMNLDTEKLLLEFRKPVILHVLDALKNSECFEKIIIATSYNSPKTMNLMQKLDFEIIKTDGVGYVEDLNQALSALDDVTLITSGDLPLLDGDIIKKIVSKYNPENIWTSFIMTKNFLNSQNITSDLSLEFQGQDCFYTGISIVNANKINSLDSIKENYEILNDKRLAFNLNTQEDYELLGSS